MRIRILSMVLMVAILVSCVAVSFADESEVVHINLQILSKNQHTISQWVGSDANRASLTVTLAFEAARNASKSLVSELNEFLSNDNYIGMASDGKAIVVTGYSKKHIIIFLYVPSTNEAAYSLVGYQLAAYGSIVCESAMKQQCTKYYKNNHSTITSCVDDMNKKYGSK